MIRLFSSLRFSIISCLLIDFFFPQLLMSETIAIYNGPGTSADSIRRLEYTLQKLLPFQKVIKIDPVTLKSGSWTNKTDLLVMPGGADIPYTQALNGKGNEIIKSFVEKGGSYLGICAGAYYASAAISFDESGPLEVKGSRELGFFKGKAIGPVLAPYDYASLKGVRAAAIRSAEQEPVSFYAFFNGGPYFKDAATYERTKVWGYYQLPYSAPAMISVDYGKGRVFLSGVHFEYDVDQLDESNIYVKEALPSLKQTTAERTSFIKSIFDYLMPERQSKNRKKDILCIGKETAKNGAIYLHGMDSIQPSKQELGNRQILQRIADRLDMRIAIPRATTICKNDTLCWGWSFNKNEIDSLKNVLHTSAETCKLPSDRSLIGFSNGGYAYTQMLRFCMTRNDQTVISIGARLYHGKLEAHPLSLASCGQMIFLTGKNDQKNLNPSNDYAKKLKSKYAIVEEITFDGGHEIDENSLLQILEKITTN